MQITKLGHSCVLIETNQGRLLVDPGNLSIKAHQDLTGLDVILYTHEHGDHLHLESLPKLLAQNPQVQVVCNVGVRKYIAAFGITCQSIIDQTEVTICGINLVAFDSPHAEIYQDFGQVKHTGYLVDEKLFLAGDSFAVPPFPVEVLAPAITAPFCAIRDTVQLIEAVRPRVVLTMHDGQLNENGLTVWYGLIERLIPDESIDIIPFPPGEVFNA